MTVTKFDISNLHVRY